MGVFTSKLNLFKPATSDFVDVVADLNDNIDKLETLLGSILVDPWVAYTPTMTNYTVNVVTARYRQIGKLVTVQFVLKGTPLGSGPNPVRMSLPVAHSTALTASTMPLGGSGYTFRATAPATGIAAPYMYDANNIAFFVSDNSSLYAGSYGTWSSSDTIRGTFSYEAA